MKETLNIAQELKMEQRLSPRQVQFVRLLEMNDSELEEEVQRKLDDNLALERAETPSESGDDDYEAPQRDDSAPDYDPEDDYTPAPRGAAKDFISPQIADDAIDLTTYLNEQLGEIQLSPMQERLAKYIIGNIDENGYLTRSMMDMADDVTINTGYNVTADDIRAAAKIVRELDPPGVGAVDLRECLILQINRQPVTLETRIAKEILQNYFDLFSKKHYDQLQAKLGVSKENLQNGINAITALNPKPGSALAPSRTLERINHISPDVGVDYENGRYSVYLISSIPQLQIASSFEIDEQQNAEEKYQRRKSDLSFIKLKRDEAREFIDLLKQRSNTLLTVANTIVRLQPEFFATGDKSRLKPMILKDVADITGFDISVISRATSDKYVATSWGTFAFKEFFNEAPITDSDTSQHKILHELQKIIDAENKRHPLSDEALHDAMKEAGFDIARRTITKYREKLKIPVARLRKEI